MYATDTTGADRRRKATQRLKAAQIAARLLGETVQKAPGAQPLAPPGRPNLEGPPPPGAGHPPPPGRPSKGSRYDVPGVGLLTRDQIAERYARYGHGDPDRAFAAFQQRMGRVRSGNPIGLPQGRGQATGQGQGGATGPAGGKPNLGSMQPAGQPAAPLEHQLALQMVAANTELPGTIKMKPAGARPLVEGQRPALLAPIVGAPSGAGGAVTRQVNSVARRRPRRRRANPVVAGSGGGGG
jgi:hypothetical protein